MSHDHIIPDECKQLLHRFILSHPRGSLLIRDSGQFHYTLRYCPSRIHKRRKTRLPLVIPYAHRTDLNHLVQFRIESRHLQVDHCVIAPQHMFRFFVLSFHVQPPSSCYSCPILLQDAEGRKSIFLLTVTCKHAILYPPKLTHLKFDVIHRFDKSFGTRWFMCTNTRVFTTKYCLLITNCLIQRICYNWGNKQVFSISPLFINYNGATSFLFVRSMNLNWVYTNTHSRIDALSSLNLCSVMNPQKSSCAQAVMQTMYRMI